MHTTRPNKDGGVEFSASSLTGTKKPSNGDAQRYKKGCTFYYMTHERSTGASEFAGREPEQERKVYAWHGNIGSEKTGLRSDMVNYKMQKDACHDSVKGKQKSKFESRLFMIKKRWMILYSNMLP